MLACTRLALHKGKEMSEVKRFTWVGINGVAQRENGNWVNYEDYAALQQKLDAVLAENATIKTMNDVLSEELRGYESDGAYDGPIAHKLWHSNSEAPSTDALLNAVRAEAIEQAAEKAPWLYGDQMGRSVEAVPKEQLLKWAAQLRAETDTTPSQYESLAGGK